MEDYLGTMHADMRLLQRVGDIDLTMTELWRESVPCSVKGHGYDEARVSAEHDVVLLMEGGQVVTVLPNTMDVTQVKGENLEEYLDSALSGQGQS